MKDKEDKTGSVQKWVPVGGERANREGEENEYGGCILYLCIKIEQ
jgi:hypothetical protein